MTLEVVRPWQPPLHSYGEHENRHAQGGHPGHDEVDGCGPAAHELVQVVRAASSSVKCTLGSTATEPLIRRGRS